MDSFLEIRNLSFSFGLKALFQGVGLRLMPLDSYAVWGPSGVGKSTLLKIIAGLISGGGGDRPGIPGDGQTSRWTNPGNPGYTRDVKKSTPELPDLVHQTRETVEDADKIVTGLQNHWLIQGLISPSRKDGPIKIDGFVKSPSAALRFNLVVAEGRGGSPSRPISGNPAGCPYHQICAPCIWSFLQSHRFADFLRDHQD